MLANKQDAKTVSTDDWSEMGLGIVIWFSPVLVLYALGRALRDAISYE
jgi:hypothetical protein